MDATFWTEWANDYKASKCDECNIISEQMRKYVDERTSYDRQQFKAWFDMYIRHDPVTHITAPLPSRHHEGNGKPNGIFAGTLTMAPTDPTNENEMVIAIKKIMNQQTCPVEKYAWYVEYTKNDLPHIHFIYQTPSGNRIHQKVFKRYWKTWDEKQRCGTGHRGGYHKLVKSETAYLEYIEKESGRNENKWTT